MKVYVALFTQYDWRSELSSAEVLGVFHHEAAARLAVKRRCKKEEFPDLAEMHAEIEEAELADDPGTEDRGDW
ncbi:MAG TPA: hypothetical protein VLZ78_04370 [Terrimesophilobacter sp.]|nr:hypothetical protein [Terrimesophilobacter sp.]